MVIKISYMTRITAHIKIVIENYIVTYLLYIYIYIYHGICIDENDNCRWLKIQ